MTKKTLTIIAISLITLSCNKEEIKIPNKGSESLISKKIPVRSKADVESTVLSFLNKNHTSNKAIVTSGKNFKSNLEIEAITSEMMGYNREKMDTLLFSVQDLSADKKILVSANVNCEPILAVFDNNDERLDDLLHLSDEDPFSPFLANVIKYNEDPDSFNQFISDNKADDISYNKINLNITSKNKAVVGQLGVNGKIISQELLPRVKVNWGQSAYPYNKYTPNNWPAGCVATAVAQAMTVTRHLNSFNGVSLNWDNLVKMKNSGYADIYPEEANTIGLLLREIGKSVNMQYSANGSGAKTKDGIKLLTLGGSFYALESKGAIKLILDENPNNVILISSRTKKSSAFGLIQNGDGHAYIVDGYEIYSDGTDLMHVNYGWDGYRNGYYLTKIWSPYFTSNTPSGAIFPHAWSFYCIRKR